MIKSYSFMEAAPLIQYIENHKSRLVGKCIKHFYSNAPFGHLTDEPLVFEFDEFIIILHYFFYSNLSLQVVSPDLFHSDKTLSFLYRSVSKEPGHHYHIIHETSFPYTDCKIADIRIERFSESFEINASTGQLRPEGGDYFKTITISLENGNCFYICAEDAVVDGYSSIWD